MRAVTDAEGATVVVMMELFHSMVTSAAMVDTVLTSGAEVVVFDSGVEWKPCEYVGAVLGQTSGVGHDVIVVHVTIVIVATGSFSGDDVPMGSKFDDDEVVMDAFCGTPLLSAAVAVFGLG